MTDPRTSIIVCSRCAKESPVDSVEGWLKRELREEPTDVGRKFVCPLCGHVVYWVGIDGEMEFGI